MEKWFLGGLVMGLGLIAFSCFWFRPESFEIASPLSSLKQSPGVKETKYSPYRFEALAEREFPVGEIKLGAATRFERAYTTYVFTYKSEDKTVSGMANIPKGQGPFPVIVLLRGYADWQTYYIGHGTEKQANYYAEHGFLTLAPDFLGYGYSDHEDQDILLARFARPVTVLSLLASIPSLPEADTSRIGLWGHSNGGQIALSVLEITGQPYPTSLWAPVSLGFPQSVLVYLGDPEVGNVVKEKVDEFSLANNPKDFSIAEYFGLIKAPFIIHQGTADELIKTEWTRALADRLRGQGLAVEEHSYRGLNHNFNNIKGVADTLRQRDLKFFQRYLGR